MKEVCVEICGKKYSKARPVVADWLRYLEFLEKNKDAVLAVSVKAGGEAMQFALDYVNAGTDISQIAESADLAQIMLAYRVGVENIVEVFSEAPSEAGRKGA